MYTLPKLPYQYDALEPYIDARTMELHYEKHHQAYVTGLNDALSKHPDLFNKNLGDLLCNLDAIPADIRTAVRNHGGGHFNHTLFWHLMKPQGGGDPVGLIAREIEKCFGSLAACKQELNLQAKGRFGSGWSWLCLARDGKLMVASTANQDNPLSEGLVPLLGIDVWEHAYYLKYQNRRVDYLDAWWQVVNWQQVEENYRAAIGK